MLIIGLFIVVAVIIIITLIVMNARVFGTPEKKDAQEPKQAATTDVIEETPEEEGTEAQLETNGVSTATVQESNPIQDSKDKINDQEYRRALQQFQLRGEQGKLKEKPDKQKMQDEDYRKALLSMKNNQEKK
ncbi:hypothetical protein [Fictibacillus gelatini]|uniref:hypothetical protein n=1 Tax=Fictibacillus gelatini TaxID=225985 RepID=UPI000424DF5F|nr:hypothetical protein [Fictibacillus gelatini]